MTSHLQAGLAEKPRAEPRYRLLRVLGVGFGLAVIIGNTIGAGILRTPGDVAAQLPNAWLFLGVWILGGLYALLGAFSLAELATMIPRSGGQYLYALRALGPYAGFVVGWSDWLSTCGTTAAVSIVIGEYSGLLFPSLSGRTAMIAAAVIIFFALLQWRGIRWGGRVQNLTAVLKALAFLLLVAACFFLRGGGDTNGVSGNHQSLLAGLGVISFSAFILALQAVIYTYDGWNGVIYFSEEVREPARDLPRGLFGGVLSIICIYLLVNAALLYVLPLERLANSKLAIGAAADVIFGPRGETIIAALTVISMLSGINAYHLMSSRVLYGMSRDRLFVASAQKVNRGGTPTVALLLSTIVALLFVLSGTFNQVMAVLAFFFVANYTVSFVSVFVLRRREPQTPRPYKAWGYPWTTGLTLLCSIAFLVGAIISDMRTSLYALLILALSYPVFFCVRKLTGIA